MMECAESGTMQLAKKQNESHAVIPCVTFLSLNDDCLIEIFKYLSLDDLLMIRYTCKRLKNLSSEYFIREHRSKVLIIECVTMTKCLFREPFYEKYIVDFNMYVPNIVLGRCCSEIPQLLEICAAYKTEGVEDDHLFKSLTFDSWPTVSEAHIVALFNIVKNVEAITFANTKFHWNDTLYYVMPKLKRLTFWKKCTISNNKDIDWFLRLNSKLEYFAWHSYAEIPVERANLFLGNCPNIKLSLLTKCQKTIEDLQIHAIKVDELFVEMPKDVSSILDHLKWLCEQRLCKRLHIKFRRIHRPNIICHLELLMTFDSFIEGLYFENMDIEKNIAETICRFRNLKVLHGNIYAHDTLLSQLPKLREVFFCWKSNDWNFAHYAKIIQTFAQNAVNLEKMYLPYQKLFENVDFDALDSRRTTDFHKLKMIFKCNDGWKLNNIEKKHGTIEVAHSRSEIMTNPLATAYHESKQTDNYYYNVELMKDVTFTF